MHIYNLIKDNEIDHLKAVIEGDRIQTIAQLRFDIVYEDEDVLTLVNDDRITLAHLNPILLAVKCKSY